jgi:glutamyl-tRNA synthetase
MLSTMATGRFAPSPTGPLHVGNLRTALLAWLFARSAGSRFLLRVEDLAARPDARAVEAAQRADLRALGLDWDGDVVRQSDRRAVHDAAIDDLTRRGLTYPCWCSRREVAEAAEAPHGQPPGSYPGTCRDLPAARRAELEASGRPAALRLRATGERVTVVDRLHGEVGAVVDDLVLRRNDGVPAYNLAVVVDDADQGVEEVVRGDDLLSSTPRQAHLADLLGRPRPAWAHVPLVLGPDGRRLAKRHGAIALPGLAAVGVGVAEVLGRMAESLGLAAPGEPVTTDQLVSRFDPSAVPLAPWTFASQ